MRKFGLLGKSLKHSFSPSYFSKKFQREGINASYEAFEIPSIEELKNILTLPHLEGLNVTIPYKEDVLPFLNYRDNSVEKIGACNCIRIKEGKLFGYNTDYAGFQASLKPLLKPWHKKALVLGSGGGAKAVCFALQNLEIPFLIVSRKEGELHYEDINKKYIEEHKLIINTTPLGMFPQVHMKPELPYEEIGKEHLLYDLIYNPELTLFLNEGLKRGADVKNGMEMLHLQAEESWVIWNSLQV